jgi:exopolysaccharide biosynthesis operon protein EpsL
MTTKMPQDGTTGRLGKRVVFATLAGLLLSQAPAFANPEDPFNVIVGASIRHESNLFRLAPSVDPLRVVGRSQRSDWLYNTYAGIRIDKPYSLQRFQLDATVTDHRYDAFSYLDYTQKEYRAAWLWSLTPRLTGLISSEQQQFAASFADFRVFTARNIQTNTIHRANADWWVAGSWHALGGVSQTRSKNTANFTAVGDYTLDTVHGGVKYQNAAGNSITFEHRQSRGEYNGRALDPVSVLDTGFRQTETDALVRWQLTGHSSVSGRLGYLERTYNNFSPRNYSGAVGRVTYLWTPTGKLSFNVATGRDMYTFQEAGNSFYVLNYLTFTPAWALTAKTTLRLKLDISQRNFRGPVVPTAILREETIRSAQLSADWAVTRSAVVSGFLMVDDRSSNISAFEYRANSAGVTAQVKF